MKIKEIASKYNFDYQQLVIFLLRKQKEIKVRGLNSDVIADEDVQSAVQLFNQYIEGLSTKAEELAAVQLQEQEKVNYAQSFSGCYEYDVVTILNVNHGQINRDKMMEILSTHAKAGWKLHSVYSNELGKNALSILGVGANSTACEDVLIFERRVKAIE